MKYALLLRPFQWYKNLLVFLPLVFSGNLANSSAISTAVLAFLSFCALSSATYVINDYADKNKDKLHPEKWNRPIASGEIGTLGALISAILLLAVGFGVALLAAAIVALQIMI